jgi:16S rRNA (cytosine1402-N4)-methyltransferase
MTDPLRRRRPRYAGKYPRRFEEKYKERNPQRYAETVAKVLASGKTPAGTHRPILVAEILDVLAPRPAEIAVDCTLGYGGHAEQILPLLQPGGKLIGLDADPVQLPKTEARLRALGFGPEQFAAQRTNFAALAQVLAAQQIPSVDIIFADLGVASMQLDDPARGFSFKQDGPLDMRMNPSRGPTASALILKARPDALARMFQENSDEPHARELSNALSGGMFPTTSALVAAIRESLSHLTRDEQELSVRRVFQALRIAVNDELSALDALLRQIPGCLKAGGRIAILTFHSGEDRRVKKAFEAAYRDGSYAKISPEVIRTTSAERHANSRAAAAKLRWARRG